MTRAIRTCFLSPALVLFSMATLGCDRTPADAHKEGVEAQRQADQEKAEARAEATDKVAEANKEVMQASDEAQKKAAKAQASANEKIREANREINAPQDDVQSWAQEKLDSVDNMIDGASVKAQSAAPAAKATFNTAMDDLKRQREVLQTEVASLETHAGDRLDKSKEQFVQHVDRIKQHIRDLERSL